MERPRILLNSGGNGNHWLTLELVGRYSNRDAIGAKVKVTTASGRVIWNHVSVSTGFMSSSDKRVHFGLGDEKQISSIEIRWPRGAVQTLKDVAADRILKVEEDVGHASACPPAERSVKASSARRTSSSMSHITTLAHSIAR